MEGCDEMGSNAIDPNFLPKYGEPLNYPLQLAALEQQLDFLTDPSMHPKQSTHDPWVDFVETELNHHNMASSSHSSTSSSVYYSDDQHATSGTGCSTPYSDFTQLDTFPEEWASPTHLAAYHYLVPKLELQQQRCSPPQLTSLSHLPEHRIRCSPSRQQSCLRRLYASFGNKRAKKGEDKELNLDWELVAGGKRWWARDLARENPEEFKLEWPAYAHLVDTL
ncbi:hypothetical protein B0H13DRAFT_2517648 [Mycena leptocephala]|nr:hypothetical protein B0H13DRAFT_2517648 [Mycena leptocephala]